MRARDLWLEGIRHSRARPNAHLLQSMAVLAGEMGLTEESRTWFSQASRLIHGNSHGIWQVCADTSLCMGQAQYAPPAEHGCASWRNGPD